MTRTATGTSASTPGSAACAERPPDCADTAAVAAVTMPASTGTVVAAGVPVLSRSGGTRTNLTCQAGAPLHRFPVGLHASLCASPGAALCIARVHRPARRWARKVERRRLTVRPSGGPAVRGTARRNRDGTARPALRPPSPGAIPRHLPRLGARLHLIRAAGEPGRRAGHRALPVPAAYRATRADRA